MKEIKKVKYYKIIINTDPNVTGIKSGKEQIIDFIDDENTSQNRLTKYGENHFDLLDASFDMHKFRAHIQALPTDILSTIFLSYDGFFISEKLKNTFKEYKIGNFHYLDTTIQGFDNYTYLNLAKNKIINFEQSSFVIKNTISNNHIENITINSHEEYLDKNKAFLMSGKFQYKVIPTSIFLNETCDLFNATMALGMLVSERLKKNMVESHITGVKFEDLDIEFYIEK